jgi:hypothetical protein
MRLVYVPPEVPIGSAIPLRERWPAGDHDEPNEAVAKEKLASGLFVREVKKAQKDMED